ncbi:hypothetical protein KAU37_09705 [Candidatus Bipolaricaulota bacterium]|nr:hypothetical protein [Candidatus Bipolaricaulota bacterium]
MVDARKLLKALRDGQPIPSKEGEAYLHPKVNSAIDPALRAVEKALGLNPSRTHDVFWITGDPGKGKTQSLWQFMLRVQSLGASGKSVLAHLKLDDDSATRTLPGVVSALVTTCLADGLKAEIEDVRKAILRGSQVDPVVKQTVSFGIDLASGLTGIPSPSLFAVAGIRKFLTWRRRRERHIRRKLGERWSSDPDFLSLLCAWVGYLLRPTREMKQKFKTTLRQLQEPARLFRMFCYALEQAEYSTLIVVLDEVDKEALAALKTLWDPSDSERNEYYNDLNQVFILASLEEVWMAAQGDRKLERRLCRTEHGHGRLEEVEINPNSTMDDVTYVVEKVSSILSTTSYLRRQGVDLQNEIVQLRHELSVAGGVTWQDIWERVIDLMADLS